MANLIRNIYGSSKLCMGLIMKCHYEPVLQHCCRLQPVKRITTKFQSPRKLSIRGKWSESPRSVKIAILGGVAYILISEKIWTIFQNEDNVLKTKYQKSKVDMYSDDYILPSIPPTPERYADKVVSSADKTGLKLTLYQYKTCPFCCKVRAFLDFYGFSYSVVEVNSVTRSETKWSKYRKVPFVVLEQEGNSKMYQLKDSSMIMSFLMSLLLSKHVQIDDLLDAYPILDNIEENGQCRKEIANRYSIIRGKTIPNEQQLKHETNWRKWVDEVYVHYLSVNIYRTLAESKQSFQWFNQAGKWDDLFSWWERLLVLNVGPIAMYLISRRLRKKYNTGDDVRGNFYIQTNSWLKELKKLDSPFMGGGQPNLSDLSVYGVLTAIEGCATFDDLMANTNLKPWYTAMKEAVNNHQGSHLVGQYCE